MEYVAVFWYTVVTMGKKILLLFLLLSICLTPFPGAVFASATDSADSIQSDISKISKKLKQAQEKKASLESELAQISSSLSVTQRAIATAEIRIKQAANDIERKQAEVELIEKRLEENKYLLSGLLREMYERSSVPFPDIALAEDDAMKALTEPDDLFSVEQRIHMMLNDIQSSQEQANQERAGLEQLKSEHEDLLKKKLVEKQALAADQADTASDLHEQEATVAELQKKLRELQSDLSILTGKSYDAKDIRDAVEFASDKTGVPRGVLYGFLKMETNLGANTGQCTYADVEKVAVARYKKYGSKYKSSIALLYKRRDLFYDLVKELGYSKSKKVSCSPSGYIGQGGAMGVPQFMSDVWNGYASQVSSATGHKTPDPWNLTDGVMAMAIKLKKAGATSSSESVIKKASINYLGTFYANYYNGIVYWSKNYKKLFD